MATLNILMNKHFIKLWESAIQRFTRGGFLVGDYVKFVDDHTSCDEYKSLPAELQNQLQDLIDSGLHIRVLNIKDVHPGRYPGNIDTQNGNSVVLDIAADHGGGRYVGQFTIPSCLVKTIEYYPDVAPSIPDVLVRPNKTIIKPVEVEDEDEEIVRRTKKSQQGNGEKPSDTKLLNKNVVIPAVTAKDAKSPAVGSYTLKYMSA